MTSANPSGPTGLEPSGRSRRGSGWAQLGRRGEAVDQAAAMRGLPVQPADPLPDEHHLGERLSAFVDGELGHDSRERVQSHLATCPECLSEADEGRAVKHLLTHTGTPGPSATLMSRLMAVAALPDDEPGGSGPGGSGSGSSGSGGSATAALGAAGTIGGSRLTGGSFGRGAGASFGAGALGAQSPLPGVDPRAGRRPQQPGYGQAEQRGQADQHAQRQAAPRPAPARSERRGPGGLGSLMPAAVARPAAPRARRFVFAAAGAFSVAAVTLGGVGGVSGLLAGDDQQHGSAVNPARVGGGAPVVPITGELSVDFPVYPVRASHGAGAVPQAPYGGQADADHVIPQHLLR
ncbi:zf-HC2 domain-containing protein [Kitasatospora sp. McL0602]|uniref:zf-HC2 domain-containing protein n=1 Tax=Kitasatospora sp. McL0602 TaxID=3439530 RepID=UPI003F896878